MIVTCFGLPGSGKSTCAAALAQKELKRIKKGKSKFKRVLVNDYIYGCEHFDFDTCFGVYDMSDSLVIIDESLLSVNSRNYQNFKKHVMEQVVLHRHDNMDIWFFSQKYDGNDKIIRCCSERMYYIRSGHILPISTMIRVPQKILFPDGTGEIVQGYIRPTIIDILFAKRIWRPNYYRYFDSYWRVGRPTIKFEDCSSVMTLGDRFPRLKFFWSVLEYRFIVIKGVIIELITEFKH